MIETLLDIYDLKDEKRTGWQLRNVEDPESVVAHSWGTAFLSLKFIPENLDTEKVLKLALIHDVAEASIGDVAKRAVDAEQKLSDKKKRNWRERQLRSTPKNLEFSSRKTGRSTRRGARRRPGS